MDVFVSGVGGDIIERAGSISSCDMGPWLKGQLDIWHNTQNKDHPRHLAAYPTHWEKRKAPQESWVGVGHIYKEPNGNQGQKDVAVW